MTNDLCVSRADSVFGQHRKQPLMLGIFAVNGSGSGGITTVPSSYELTWDHSLAIARTADEIGLELFMPVSRWRGFNGVSNYAGETYETLTYMSAVAAVTKRLMTVVTLHVPFIHPVLAAKAIATIDHVSGGRGGINMVMGWYKAEMGMFGLAPRQTSERYAYAAEWLEIVQRLWAEGEPFDFKGKFFNLESLISGPKPIQIAPPIVSAATSPEGIAFAATHADLTFARSDDPDRLREHSKRLRASAEASRNAGVGVASLGLIVCRETEQEARDYFKHLRDNADLAAARNLALSSGIDIDKIPEGQRDATLRDIAMSAGSAAVIGTPEQVAEKIAGFQQAGVDALFLGFHDYLHELPYFAEKVLPLLEERGVRLSRQSLGQAIDG